MNILAESCRRTLEEMHRNLAENFMSYNLDEKEFIKSMTYTLNQAYEVILLAITLWREARSEPIESKRAVAWSIRNRVKATPPRWWGHSWVDVLIKPWQYTSVTGVGDPNLVKWPKDNDPSWQECLVVADEVFNGQGNDTTGGATHYFDKSLDNNPPKWTKAADSVHKVDIGSFRFWRAA